MLDSFPSCRRGGTAFFPLTALPTRIDKNDIKNFRLLNDVNLRLEERTTVIVGCNNSGKTSLTELFRRLLQDKSPTFRLEDFSLCAHHALWTAFVLKCNGGDEADVRLPFSTGKRHHFRPGLTPG